MNRIFICADTHGLMDIKKIKNLVKSKQLDKEDYIIICGDVGFGWNEDITYALYEFYNKLETNILFIDGNHENFNELNKFPTELWKGGVTHRIGRRIRYLTRSQVFNICGKTFLTLGGADSHDFENSIEGESWFREEKITKDNINEALVNVKKFKNKVDYILTHTPNYIFTKKLYEKFTQCGESFPIFLQAKLNYNQSGRKLDEIAEKVEFKKWFCGHWHIDEKIDKYCMIYENIIEI